MNKKVLITQAITTLLAISCVENNFANTMSDDLSAIKGLEKCYGVAKKNLNDCSNQFHQCAGEAKVDGDKSEWLLTPTGLCTKIVNGKLSPNDK